MADQEITSKLAQFEQARIASLKIVKTTSTPNGKMVDWIPIESQLIEGKIATPPPAPTLPSQGTEQKAVHVAFDTSVEAGPHGTVPIPRLDFSKLAAGLSVEQVLSKKGGLKVNPNRPKAPSADPNPFGYFHGTSGQSTTLYGCDAFLNVWDPQVHNGGDHSIMQCGLQNYDDGANFHSIEAGWTVDPSLNGNSMPHVFTYYTTNGYTKDGDNLGGYNRSVKGWVQYDANLFPGIGLTGMSQPGGGQTGIEIKYQLWQGNWWFAIKGIWMGYYPGSLFKNGIATKAEWVGFWGEVYSSLANPNQTKDQMGSGRKAEAGWTHACYQSNLRNQSNPSGAMVNHNGSPSAENSSLYDIKTTMNSGGSWGSYFYCGGQSS